MIDLEAPMKKSVKKKIAAAPALAMHSAASPDWGTPMLSRRFAQVVLRPAALTSASIDLDYATSVYWQSWWPDDDRPAAFLDGAKGRDVLVEADRRRAQPTLGSGFQNPPGLGGGDMVQQCWALLEADHREGKLGSGFYKGFSVEQFGSLQNAGVRNPLTTSESDFITTIVPSRRAHYVLHPKVLIEVLKRKQLKREPKSKQWLAEQRLIKKLRTREDDRPVDAGAPSHLSFVTILWSFDGVVRAAQRAAARKFLDEQRDDSKSLFHKFEVIGPL